MALRPLGRPSLVVVIALSGLIALGCGLGDSLDDELERQQAAVDQPVDVELAVDEWGPFFGAGYVYCDAKVLAGYWNTDTKQSKTKASAMIAGGRPDAVVQALSTARPMAGQGTIPGCRFHETDFSYADAEALAAFWGTTVSEAKATLASKATWGDIDMASDLIAQARARGAAGEGPEHGVEGEAEWIQAFLSSDRLDTCHAHMLAEAWGTGLTEAKASLGYKLSNAPRSLELTLRDVRSHVRNNPTARCSWGQIPYGYDDAEALAKLWGTDVDEAKTRIEQKYVDGTEAVVRDELVRAGRG